LLFIEVIEITLLAEALDQPHMLRLGKTAPALPAKVLL
jgi:hypothetical protein